MLTTKSLVEVTDGRETHARALNNGLWTCDNVDSQEFCLDSAGLDKIMHTCATYRRPTVDVSTHRGLTQKGRKRERGTVHGAEKVDEPRRGRPE